MQMLWEGAGNARAPGDAMPAPSSGSSEAEDGDATDDLGIPGRTVATGAAAAGTADDEAAYRRERRDERHLHRL